MKASGEAFQSGNSFSSRSWRLGAMKNLNLIRKISPKGSKHVLSKVEGVAKGDSGSR
jgi:hypothetical protein